MTEQRCQGVGGEDAADGDANEAGAGEHGCLPSEGRYARQITLGAAAQHGEGACTGPGASDEGPRLYQHPSGPDQRHAECHRHDERHAQRGGGCLGQQHHQRDQSHDAKVNRPAFAARGR